MAACQGLRIRARHGGSPLNPAIAESSTTAPHAPAPSAPAGAAEAVDTDVAGTPSAPQRWHEDVPAGFGQRSLSVFIVLVPPLLLATALMLGVARPRPVDLVMLVVGFILTGLGITVGFHRYFTHRSFDTSRPMAYLFGVLGAMAWQGPALEWAETHRRHHRHSDLPDDPHSPHLDGDGVKGLLKGALFAHQGWMFMVNIRGRDMARYAPDLRADPVVISVSRFAYPWAIAGLLIPGGIAWLVEPTWTSVWLGILWGGLLRAFAVNHVTWCINSVCHLWGSRDYRTSDHSRNVPILGVLGLGEGWHNNHHAFPSSARLGLRWWQFDPGWVAIRTLQMLGAVWNVRVPGRERQSAKASTA